MGHKSKKHEKKSKKSKKHRSSEERVRSNEHNALESALTFGLIKFPVLLDDLPVLLNALNAGKTVYFNDKSSEIECFLNHLLSQLPLEATFDNGFKKKSDMKSISKYLLTEMLSSKQVIQPSERSNPQITSIEVAKMLTQLLNQYPDLWGDLSAMLSNFIDMETIDLTGLDNVTIKEQIILLFNKIGAQRVNNNEDNDISVIFSLDKMNKYQRNDVIECCKIIVHMLESGQIYNIKHSKIHSTNNKINVNKNIPNRNEIPQQQKAHNMSGDESDGASDDSSSDSSSSSDQESADEGDKVPQRKGPSIGPTIGPAMPSQQQLEQAARYHTQVRLSIHLLGYIC
jgi:hypothetical protein